MREGTRSTQDGAFAGCYKLSSVNLPDIVTAIGHNAFKDCPLQSAPLKDNGLTYWRDSLVGADSYLMRANVHEGTAVIAPGAFSYWESDYYFDSKGCTAMKSVTLPSSPLSLPFCALYQVKVCV
ncbi:MAG: leucine-rich repeat protein [bacterium]|nr:leucine-rich repeat protein [bacterium]